MNFKKVLFFVVVISVFSFQSKFSYADQKEIKMATTTSTQDSGLLDVLLPEFQKDTGIQVKAIAKGTGAAIRDGIDGNVDVVFVHAKEKEEAFVKDGFGTKRYPVMHNDFVIIGPKNDPAGIKKAKTSIEALKLISQTCSPFVSRGDDSGTHVLEQNLWKETGIGVTKNSKVGSESKQADNLPVSPKDSEKWYFSIGQGMGKTLIFAHEKQAYAISDRATYLNFKLGGKQPLDLEILFEGDPKLLNPYSVIPVNPKKFPHVKYDLAEQFAEWLISGKGQSVIANYKVQGKPVFFPDAMKETSDSEKK
ncbi:MAG: substrate-binding domain-containing protein [Candidatus Riflebacteria bacterium]|nr:substrate-binding domain-containing protein [Candidatus Riflebacteria bacterium]